MNRLEQRIEEALAKRAAANSLRSLSLPGNLVDFYSNDFLGLSRSAVLRQKLESAIKALQLSLGATGSRLLSGNYPLMEETEEQVAKFHKAEAGLIFPSGYQANVGLFSTVPQKGDTVLYDEYCHASIRDGLRLSLGQSYSFRHNDLEDLQKKLEAAKGEVFVVVESLYSMDGDQAPLKELVEICSEKGLHLIVDEAHATGVYGPNGEGLCVAMGIEKKLFTRIHTFGKAIGAQGAIVVGSASLRNYLINFCRSFIYSTGLAPIQTQVVKLAYELLPELNNERAHIFHLSEMLTDGWDGLQHKGDGPIHAIVVNGVNEVKQLAGTIKDAGLNVRPILSPTVPQGTERIRICLHTFNTDEEVRLLNQIVKTHFE